MKVTLERNHLLKSLGHVHRVVERRNTYPILANVLLKPVMAASTCAPPTSISR
jgi:DNA polymerase III sliding clamp (beta) subunit (PCNA family)